MFSRADFWYSEICRNVDASVRLEDKLVVDSEEDHGLPLEFLQALVSRFEEDPGLEDAFKDAIQNLSVQLNLLDLSDNYKPYLVVSKHGYRQNQRLC